MSARQSKFLIPFLTVFAASWSLVALATQIHTTELITACLLQGFVGCLLWMTARQGPSTLRFMIGTTAFVASVALLRDGTGANPGVTVMALLPITLAATRANKRELVFALLVSAIALYLPEIVVGGPKYPLSTIREVTLTLLVGIVIGATVLGLVRDLSTEQERAREMADEARTQLITEDALRRVATLVASGPSSSELFSEVSLQLARIAGASIGGVIRFRLNEETPMGELVGGWRADTGTQLAGRRFDLNGGSASARVFQTGRPVVLGEYPAEEGVEGAIAAVAAPIIVGGRLWGAASAGFTLGQPVPVGIQARFERFAELVAMAISNADSNKELVQHATIDALTGIPNRRSFDQQLIRELELAQRRKQPLALALLDVDYFKSVNDTFGHPTGDRVLARVAGLLSAEARTGEMVARLGGEEFVWLMPDTTAEEAYVAVERARQAVTAHDFDLGRAITLSAGINSNLRVHSGLRLLAGADEALYAAKSRGRDQTVAAPASLSSADDRVKPAAA